MKRRYRLLIGVATATGVGFGSSAGYEAMSRSLTVDSPPEANEVVASCAPLLGSVAVESTELPKGCEDAAGYIPYRSTEVSNVNYDRPPSLKNRGVTHISEERVYAIPTRQDFVEKMEGVQDFYDDRNSFNRKLKAGFVGSMALCLGWSVYTLTGFKRRSRDSNDQWQEYTSSNG